MRLALYEPDIPQNTGTILRMAACLGVGVDIIEPCGFVFGDRQMRRAGMDYMDQVSLQKHDSWQQFQNSRIDSQGRLVLMTTHGLCSYNDFQFHADDILLFGRESAGVPDSVHEAADERLRIPMKPEMRSLNVAVSAAMVLGEALRQTNGFFEGS